MFWCVFRSEKFAVIYGLQRGGQNLKQLYTAWQFVWLKIERVGEKWERLDERNVQWLSDFNLEF